MYYYYILYIPSSFISLFHSIYDVLLIYKYDRPLFFQTIKTSNYLSVLPLRLATHGICNTLVFTVFDRSLC